MINTNKLNSTLENYKSITKDYFTIDIDNLDWLEITLIYANLFSKFLPNNLISFKEELEYKKLFRVHYSSSKTGVHIKVNIKNNIMENLYYRALFEDDKYRINSDLVRLNHISEFPPSYDVAFKSKSKNFGEVQSKTFKFINPLEKINMKKKTFYKLIQAYHNHNNTRVSTIISQFKKKSHTLILNRIELINFTETDESQLKKIFNKYSDKNNIIKNPEAFTKSLSRYVKFNMRI